MIRFQAKIFQAGTSKAVIIPSNLVKIYKLKKGDFIEFTGEKVKK